MIFKVACFGGTIKMSNTTFLGLIIPTKENWNNFQVGEEFGFTCSRTGLFLEDGTVFFDYEGVDHYIFENKETAADYFFNGKNIKCQHSFYIGSRDEHPTLDGWCKRMGIELDENEDGSSVFSAYRNAIA